MILAVAPNTESTCLYRGKTQTNCLSQSRGVDVRDSVLITNAAIGQVESLSRYVCVYDMKEPLNLFHDRHEPDMILMIYCVSWRAMCLSIPTISY